MLSAYTALLVLETDADYARFHIDRNALADILTVDGGRLAKLALGAALADHAGHLGDEPVELINHSVDGVVRDQHVVGAAEDAVKSPVAEMIFQIHRRGVQCFVYQQRVGVKRAGHYVGDRMVKCDVRQCDRRDLGSIKDHPVGRIQKSESIAHLGFK